MLDYVKIGQNIRKHRRAAGLSQEQLAERIWISTTHMSLIETGSTKLSLPVLVDLANALRISVDEILHVSTKTSCERSLVEIVNMLEDCTPVQLQILSQILSAAKTALTENMPAPPTTQENHGEADF